MYASCACMLSVLPLCTCSSILSYISEERIHLMRFFFWGGGGLVSRKHCVKITQQWIRRLGFQTYWCHQLAVWPWERHLVQVTHLQITKLNSVNKAPYIFNLQWFFFFQRRFSISLFLRICAFQLDGLKKWQELSSSSSVWIFASWLVVFSS